MLDDGAPIDLFMPCVDAAVPAPTSPPVACSQAIVTCQECPEAVTDLEAGQALLALTVILGALAIGLGGAARPEAAARGV